MFNKIKLKINEFLIGTQKYTGTDNVYIARSGGWLTIGNIISAGVSFLLSIAFARYISKETYGEFRYILSAMSIFAIASLKGLDDALIQSVARGFEGSYKKLLNTRLKWTILGSAASVIWGLYFLINKGQPALAISFFITALFLPPMITGNTYLSYLQGKKLFGTNVKYDVLTQSIATSFLILSLFFVRNIILITLIFFLSHTLVRNFFSIRTLKKYPPNDKEDSQTISYGKHLSLMSVVTLAANELDKIILFSFAGATQLAIYSFAMMPIKQMRNLLRNLRALAYPKFSERDKEEIKKTLPKKIIKFSILLAALGGLYVIIAPYLYKIFFPKYMDSVYYSKLLIFSLASFPASMLTLALASKMKKKELYYVNTLQSASTIIFLIVLTPLYGMMGVIFARILAAAFYLALSWVMFKRL